MTKKWLGEADSCDICEGKLEEHEWFVDGATMMGPWALMCPKCFSSYGRGLGTGLGQMYNYVTKEKVEVTGR